MKKKRALKFFARCLVKSLLVIASLGLAGLVSYKVSLFYLSKSSKDIASSPSEIEKIMEEAKTDEISKNLLFVVDGDKKISHLMLEICNTKTNNMDYVTIPVKVDYTIPSKMYQKLASVEDEVPQIVRLAKLRSYFTDFEDTEAYGYCELVLEKMLGIDISYYTVLTEDVYSSHYQEVTMTTNYEVADPNAEDAGTGSVEMAVSQASDSYKNQLKDLGGDENKIVDFIKDQYGRVASNLTVYNKIGYLECYQKLNVDNFHYWGVPGPNSGKKFVVDTESTKKFLEDLESNTTSYTEPQTEGENADGTTGKKKQVSSVGKNILLLNGSKITGLAASTQTTLTSAGFTVPKVGDYTSEVLTHTRIIVKKKTWGQDLAIYFKDPEIVVGDVEDGYDIEIILGTVDAN